MKRIIIIFVSVSIILVLITAFLIFYKLQLSTNKPPESENISKVLYEEYHLPIKSLTVMPL
jgi:NADH:ubiquinone oxidoreductase subunit 6 (subunit J)